MPRELPGLYWNEEKQRYFPLSSKPKISSALSTPHAYPSAYPQQSLRPLSMRNNSEKSEAKRRIVDNVHNMWHASETSRATGAPWRRSRALHDISAISMARTSLRCSRDIPTQGITAFCSTGNTSSGNGSTTVLAGDARGWLHYLEGDPERMSCSMEINLGSSISSICSWGTHYVATSFGAPAKILVRNSYPEEAWSIFGLSERTCHDVWNAHLYDRRLLLGAAKKAYVLLDIEIGRGSQTLETGSDVLAVHLDNHLAYTGTRHGLINRFDTRINTRTRQTLLDQRFQRTTSSITHLNIVHDWELLVSTIRGDLETHDMRFMRGATPLMQFHGHVNSYSFPLGLAVDPQEDFLFAAGQDHIVRSWSLRTGQRVISPADCACIEQKPLLDRAFDGYIAAMQVLSTDMGPCLWVASGPTLHLYHLGQRSVEILA
ncbi:uncharacterized protein LAESUDRAFT_722980 [Laetiporus sulphureus 93-53]|uniref:WD40 repeat-like protein n=1 Tax=Laetiporus sulphureus 93-53 TaxID=1314785 RepID=A0A165FNS5_9APHY|nr:uncharacterized protein LAESUDRAFT_722980 [Laetiporus sulphureus 93-53]KZT09248.1 hypothetical protein LAESUDRAFT_722980 [Laetiporus sulphureus 93-53]